MQHRLRRVLATVTVAAMVCAPAIAHAQFGTNLITNDQKAWIDSIHASLGATACGQIVGCAVYGREFFGRLFLSRLLVDAPCRRRGVATQLVRRVEASLRFCDDAIERLPGSR